MNGTSEILMHAPKIISIGEVLWDLFPDGERFGGAPANFACHTAIGGGDVVMLSAVGDDIHGKRAVKVLQDYGCLLYTSPSPRDLSTSRMPSSA